MDEPNSLLMMSQYRRTNATGPESVVYLHLKDKVQMFEDTSVHILDTEDKLFERVVREDIFMIFLLRARDFRHSLQHHLTHL